MSFKRSKYSEQPEKVNVLWALLYRKLKRILRIFQQKPYNIFVAVNGKQTYSDIGNKIWTYFLSKSVKMLEPTSIVQFAFPNL